MRKHCPKIALLCVLASLTAGLEARADSIRVTATYTGDSPTEVVQITSNYLLPTRTPTPNSNYSNLKLRY